MPTHKPIKLSDRRGRNAASGDKLSGSDIVSRTVTQKNSTPSISFPMNGSESSKYPANTMKKNQVTPGSWTTKNKI